MVRSEDMSERMRFFEEVAEKYKKYDDETILPRRGTPGSAGHDFRVKEDVILYPGDYKLVFTDVKAFFPEDEVLKLYMRSSAPVGLILKNIVPIIDSDYYGNQKTGGNIGLSFMNIGNKTILIPKGERIVQGIFVPYYITNDDDPVNNERLGGFGSTGK
jgi:dUTP pyrophosphatase